jgi:hypothetical protein
LILVLVMTDHEREQARNKPVLAAVIVVFGCEAVGEIEREVDRHERVETQRNHAEPNSDRQPQPIWPHCGPSPRATRSSALPGDSA